MNDLNDLNELNELSDWNDPVENAVPAKEHGKAHVKPGGKSGGAHFSPRHRAREFVIQGLYQHLVGGQDMAAIIVQAESAGGFDKVHRDLYDALLDGTLGQLAVLQTLLEPHIERSWAEISPIERGVLLLAACELKDHPETPYRVVLNEAIELAKSYGGTDGHKFVNGILDKLGPQLRPHEIAAR